MVESVFSKVTYSTKMTGYRFWAQNVWPPNSTFFSLSVLSKTVENEIFNLKWHKSYSKVRTQRMLYLNAKLIF